MTHTIPAPVFDHRVLPDNTVSASRYCDKCAHAESNHENGECLGAVTNPFGCQCAVALNADECAYLNGYNIAKYGPGASLTGDAVVLDVREVAHGGEVKVLMIERGGHPFKGYLALPGGHLNQGEEFLAGAVRELEEETGLEFPETMFHLVGHFGAPGRDPRGRYVSAAYVVEVSEDLPTLANLEAKDDAASFSWVPLSRLGEDNVAFDHLDIVNAALATVRNLKAEAADDHVYADLIRALDA